MRRTALHGPVLRRALWHRPTASSHPSAADRKWGSPYLTRDFFSRLGQRMADRVLLVLAETAEGAPGQGTPVAGALNLIGSDALYGRNWGSIYGDRVPFLHFEVRGLEQGARARGASAPGPRGGGDRLPFPPAHAPCLPSWCRSSATTKPSSSRLNGACAAWRRGRRVSAAPRAAGWAASASHEAPSAPWPRPALHCCVNQHCLAPPHLQESTRSREGTSLR